MINDVIRIFLTIILQFIAELTIFEIIVFHAFDRYKQSIWRIALSLLLIVSIGFALSFFYYFFGNTVWGRVFVYFTLFFAFITSSKFIFNEKLVPVVFCLGIAYALQNIMYKVWLMIYVTFEQTGLTESWNPHFGLIYRVMYYTYIVLFVLATAFIFNKFFRKQFVDRHFSKKILLVTTLCLLTTIVLCSYQDVLFGELSTSRENHFDSPTLYFLRQSGNLLSLLTCVLVLYLSSKAIVENRLEKEVEYLEHTIKQSKQQYEISKDTIEMINIKCHDIKYQIRSLANNGKVSESDLKELEQSVTIYDSKFETGNQMLNVLLWEKSSFCEQNGISFSCMIDGENFDFMDSGDLYCLFGNLIDNALEAVTKIKDVKKRIINLSAKRKGNIVVIEENNYFAGKLEFADGLPLTTKDDKRYHGFGTRSLKIIARKYDGELIASTNGNIFSISIILTDNSTK